MMVEALETLMNLKKPPVRASKERDHFVDGARGHPLLSGRVAQLRALH